MMLDSSRIVTFKCSPVLRDKLNGILQFGMGGTEAIQKLIGIDPDVKAIVSTGYSNYPVVTNFREYGFHGALTKGSRKAIYP